MWGVHSKMKTKDPSLASVFELGLSEMKPCSMDTKSRVAPAGVSMQTVSKLKARQVGQGLLKPQAARWKARVCKAVPQC